MGRFIVQVIIHKLPTLTGVTRVGFLVENMKEGGGAFLRVLLFPLPILIPPAAPYSLIILSPTP
jgi:hypothetical protein